MIQIPEPSSAPAVADWVEFEIVTSGQDLSKAKLGTLIEQAAGDEPTEAFVNDVWQQLEDRQGLYAATTPYEIQARIIKPKIADWKTCPEYVACLIWSMLGVPGGGAGGTKLFERISRIVVAGYLKGDAVIFGWPVVAGATDTIENKVRTLAATLKERFVEAPAERYKDRGVDVVGWTPFADGRTSQVIVFTQCAAGHNWPTKTKDVPLEAWKQYVHWSAAPVAGLAIPQIIPRDRWHDIACEAGLLFDRARIMHLVCATAPDATLRRELVGWCETQIKENEI